MLRAKALGNLEEIVGVKPEEWNEDVIKLDGCCFHSYEWSLCSSGRNKAVPLYFRMRDDTGKTASLGFGLEVVKRLGGLSIYKTLSFGSLPASADDGALAEMIKEIISVSRERKMASLEINTFGTPIGAEVLRDFGFSLGRRWEFLVDIAMPEDELWKKINAKKRNKIRKAQKANIKVIRGAVDTYVQELRRLAVETQKRKAEQNIVFPVAGESYYQSLKNGLIDRGLGKLYLAYESDKAVAAAFFVAFNHKVYSMLSSANARGLEVAGPDFILWTAMIEYQKEGYNVFNLGGVSEKELNGQPLEDSGLYQFKKTFGATVHPCFKGTLILRPKQFKLYSFLKALKSRLAG